MPGRHPSRLRGFTLIELMASTVIIGILAGVVAPIVLQLAIAHGVSSEQRQAAQAVGAATERVVRMIREAPSLTSGSSSVDITTGSATVLQFGSGHRVELIGSTLWLTVPGQSASPLLQGVSLFSMSYIGDDGVTNTSGALSTTQRINIQLAAGGFELNTAAFIRIARRDN